MPELAEVELSRRQWGPGLGHQIKSIGLPRPGIRVFRDTDPTAIQAQLVGKRLLASQTRGKQMLFRFSGDLWLGIHLGMSGELRCECPADYPTRKHDHLALRQDDRTLVFADQRHFGRVRLHHGTEPPAWWSGLAPDILSAEFTVPRLLHFLTRRRRTPLKALLLMQEHFPGVGNWMADEILWRASLHPATAAGTLNAIQCQTLWRVTRWVCRTAIRIISDDWTYPKSWLFPHRWEAGGQCPRCRTDLQRATIGGRTTCWCPHCQPTAPKRKSLRPKSLKPKSLKPNSLKP